MMREILVKKIYTNFVEKHIGNKNLCIIDFIDYISFFQILRKDFTLVIAVLQVAAKYLKTLFVIQPQRLVSVNHRITYKFKKMASTV